MSAHQRHRFASRLAHCLAATSLATTGAACVEPDPELPPELPSAPSSPVDRIARELSRLEALEVIELGAVSATRTEHQWVPYGGVWSSTPVPLTAEEQADRLDSLADVAEQAVADADAGQITDSFSDEHGTPSLCTRLDSDHFCLDRALHAGNLHAVNQLEIVEVVDILRTEPAATGFCYASWDTVSEADCVRAFGLRAIADATREFPGADPPDGDPE
jgi:hypothetical protein